MRRYTTFPESVLSFTRYFDKGGMILASTVPALTIKDQIQYLQAFERAGKRPFYHFTLSMPEGEYLSWEEWDEVIRFVLHRSGVPVDQTPWIVVGREPASCDHIHILVAPHTFLGRPIDIRTSRKLTNKLHRDVCLRLGLPQPSICDAPQFALASVKKEKNEQPFMRSLKSDLDRAFVDFWPVDINAVNDALERTKSPWRLSEDRKRTGQLLATHLPTGHLLQPNTISPFYKPSLILKRLEFAARLRAASFYLSVARITQVLAPTALKTLMDKGKHDANERRLGNSHGKAQPYTRRRKDITSSDGVVDPFDAGKVNDARSGVVLNDRNTIHSTHKDGQRYGRVDGATSEPRTGAPFTPNDAFGCETGSGQSERDLQPKPRLTFGDLIFRVLSSLKKRHFHGSWKAGPDLRMCFTLREGELVHLDCRAREFSFCGAAGDSFVQELKHDLGWQPPTEPQSLLPDPIDPFAELLSPPPNGDEADEGPQF